MCLRSRITFGAKAKQQTTSVSWLGCRKLVLSDRLVWKNGIKCTLGVRFGWLLKKLDEVYDKVSRANGRQTIEGVPLAKSVAYQLGSCLLVLIWIWFPPQCILRFLNENRSVGSCKQWQWRQLVQSHYNLTWYTIAFKFHQCLIPSRVLVGLYFLSCC